jgi:hypothetical protein
MNGNGQDFDKGSVPQIEPPSTGGLWGDMFGLGPLMKMITDPALGLHAHGMMEAIIEGAKASGRIEAKLNKLLEALGHDVADIERTAAMARNQRPPVLLAANGADGDRRFAVASGAADDGNRFDVANAQPSDETLGT